MMLGFSMEFNVNLYKTRELGGKYRIPAGTCKNSLFK